MPPTTVLIIDNDLKWLRDTKKFLESNIGYNVITATTYGAGKTALQTEEFNVALIDIHLLEEGNLNDISGIELAKHYAPRVPKIMVTQPPTFDMLRESLRKTQGLPAGIDFVGKNEGKAALVSAIEDAVHQKGLLRWRDDLIFTPPNPDVVCDIFVIMPFATTFDLVAQALTVDLAKSLSINIKRGDDFFTHQNIMQDVWSGILNAKLVIADCTDRNANVFYEVGLSHATGQKVIMITQNLGDVPFDIRHLRIIEYENTVNGLISLLNELSNAISKLGLF